MKLYPNNLLDQFSLSYFDRKTHEHLMSDLKLDLKYHKPNEACVGYVDESACYNKFYYNTSLDMGIKTDIANTSYIYEFRALNPFETSAYRYIPGYRRYRRIRKPKIFHIKLGMAKVQEFKKG